MENNCRSFQFLWAARSLLRSSKWTKLLPPSFTTVDKSTRNKKRRELKEADQRFETFPDLIYNWTVWDLHEDDFAEVGTHRLRSLSEANAKAFCSLLNRLFSKSAEQNAVADP
jgi:hypothetical protein